MILAAAIAAIPAAAQDFTSPKPQFLTFSVGVPLGYDLAADSMTAGRSFGISFAITDKLSVGYDGTNTFNTLRTAFSFTDNFGAAVAFGNHAGTAAVGLGLFFDLFPGRSSQGLAYGLRLRVDYFADTNAFSDGQLLFGVGAAFGL